MNGKRLRALRREEGLTQAELAEELDVAPSSISVFETTNVGLAEDRLERARELLDNGHEVKLPTSNDYDEFQIVSTLRRRLVILVLDRVDVIDRNLLTDIITAVENESEFQKASSAARKRVYIGLTQSEFPKLESSGIVRLRDRDTKLERTALTSIVAEKLVGWMQEVEPHAIQELNRVFEEVEIEVWEATVPLDIRMFNIPTRKELRMLREEAELTQIELAERAGVTPNAISNFESGKTESMNSSTMVVILDVLRAEL